VRSPRSYETVDLGLMRARENNTILVSNRLKQAITIITISEHGNRNENEVRILIWRQMSIKKKKRKTSNYYAQAGVCGPDKHPERFPGHPMWSQTHLFLPVASCRFTRLQ